MPQPRRAQAEDNSDFESSQDLTDSDSSDDSDEDLVQVYAAIAPTRDGATVQEVRQVCLILVNVVVLHYSHTSRRLKLHRTCY